MFTTHACALGQVCTEHADEEVSISTASKQYDALGDITSYQASVTSDYSLDK